MNLDGHRCTEWLNTASGLEWHAGWPAQFVLANLPFDRWVDAVPWVLSAAAAVLGGAAVYVAMRARQVAHSALQEAGEAKARAQASGPGLSSEALAATERVWTARLNAIEAQIQTQLSRPRSNTAHNQPASADLTARIEGLEKALHGLSVLVAQSRRTSSSTGSAAPMPELQWPGALKGEKPGLKELRDLLQEGAKVRPSEFETFSQMLKEAESWSAKRRPSPSDVLLFLSTVSQSFHAVLRNGALLPAPEVARMSDRLAGLLRPLWQQFHPGIECRVFYPGAPFDPEWMEDQNPAGLQRPTISDTFSWAVHEKNLTGRRLMAKSRVTTE